jgi:nucleoside-diphosphate-sugar epimerase
VYVSSLAAVGPSPPGQVVDEETAPRPITAYGQSKLAGEQEVLRAGDSVAVTIVRPPAIYGPRDRAFLALFKMARLGIFPVIGLRPRRVSLVHVADVVEALVLAATQANGAGRTYFVSSRSPYSSQDIRAALASACGRRLRRVPLLGWQLYSAGLWEEATARVRRRLPSLTRDRARELLQPSWVCSAERAERELGFTPRVPLDEGLRQTLAWYRQAGWLA